jgi:hypothetical protein
MEKMMKQIVSVPSPISRRACTLSLVFSGLVLTTVRPAWAFDQAAYLARLDATRAELVKKTLADSKATLARLDELVTIGIVALREYGAKNPKYAKLMEAVIANAPDMKTYSDSQLEDIWGEKGNGGDAVGVPLKSLGDFDPTRNVMELIIGPSAAYIHIKKWQTAQRAKWLDQASDELHETAEHLNRIK